MDVHKRISGVLMGVLGGMGLLSMAFALFMLATGSALLPQLLGSVGLIVAGVLGFGFGLWCLAAVLGGLSAYLGGDEAGRLLVPVAVLALVGFPMGTLAGVYTLWAWWRPAPAPR